MIDVDFVCCNARASVTIGEMMSVKCLSCGRESGPHESFHDMYREWYRLVPVRDAAVGVCRSMKNILLEISSRPSFVPGNELVALADNEAIGRRTMQILFDTGLVRAKYVVDGEEVDAKTASGAKKSGKKVDVLMLKAFSRNNGQDALESSD